MTNQVLIYKGPTGCGKTYQAFNRAGKAKVIYGGPCRQLIYETACKYGTVHSCVRTSDMVLGDRRNYDRQFCTFECITRSDIRGCDILVIDEAHFASDHDRGPHIRDLIYFGRLCGKKVILLSATMDFTIEGAKVINLPPRGQSFKKIEISEYDCFARIKAGVPSLVFHKRKDACGDIGRSLGVKTAVITADTSVADRIRLIDLYMTGRITLIEATNAMAQGVNVPCENLYIKYNTYDDPACLIQKLGRLGRTGVTPEGRTLTWCAEHRRQESFVKMAEPFNCQEQKKERLDISPKRRTKVVDYDLRTPATPDQVAELKARIVRAWTR